MNRNTANATQLQEEIDAKIIEGVRPFIEMRATVFRMGKQSKKPVETWGELPPRSLEEICAAPSAGRQKPREPLENFAIALGARAKTPHGYLHCIDYDLDDPAMKHRADAALNFALPKDARAYAVRSGSGNGYHFYFFAPEPLPGQVIERVEGAFEVVLKGTGQYVAAPGSLHPDTGKPYRWIKGKRLEPDMLDLITPPVVNMTPFERAEPERTRAEDPLIAELLGKTPTFTPRQLQELLDEIPIEATGRDSWLKAQMAVHYESDGADWGFDMVDAWSAGDTRLTDKGKPMYPGRRILRRQWDGFKDKPGAIKGGTLLSLVRAAGGCPWTDDDFDESHEPFEDLLGHSGGDLLGGNDDEALDLTGNAEKPKAALRFLTPSDCEAAPAREYLIKGFLSRGDVGAVVGAPGAGKSLIAPYLGYMVAQGEQAFGMRTKKGGVFYVAAEDPHGMRGRIKALRKQHGDAEGFHLVEGVSDLLSKESPDMAALLSAAKEQRPALIVIDTLALAFPGLEENDAAAMGRVIAVTRALTKWGAAVLLVHHDAKSGDGLPRGHSSLNGNLDVTMNVKFDAAAGVVRGELGKNKNGSRERDIAFKIAVEQAGTDEDGDPITLPRCNPLEGEYGKMSLSPSQHKLLQILSDMADFEDGEEVPESELKMRCIAFGAVSGADSEESRKRVYRKAKSDLASTGVIRVSIREADGVEVVKRLKFHAVPCRNCEPGSGGLGADNPDNPSG